MQRLGAYMLEALVARLASTGTTIYKALKYYEAANEEDLSYMHMLHQISLSFKFGYMSRGPLHIRITAIGDSTSSDAMQMVGNKLSKLAEDFKVLFEFDVVAIFACDVQLQNLRVQSRVALAVNFAFMLHQMPDESVITQNQRDRLLNLTQTFSNSFHVCLKLWTIITKQCLSQ
ncbi:Scarecrow-like transcription factor PAT1 [Glycine soja]|uniref:Scarecrow-like transcription factor PAT1 n=1 Tax=Glycine soja TaxID=3848 RepID=A0A0B2SQ06_GLYSO|nr:hypothetical protein JHK86_038638 [Glycine max]KHN46918.1 Scarecrow-like transcription factor PAT1 [Glycine soja]